MDKPKLERCEALVLVGKDAKLRQCQKYVDGHERHEWSSPDHVVRWVDTDAMYTE